MSATAVKN